MRNSKQAIHAILSAVAVILCVCVLMNLATNVYFGQSAYYYQDAEVREALAGETDTLLCGSSHGFRSMMPTVLDEELNIRSYNISCSMMTMGGRYELLKKEIARNPIETVYLEVSYNAVTRDRAEEGPEGDLYLLGRLDNVWERISYTVRNFQPDEYHELFLDLMERTRKAWSLTRNGKITEPAQWETHGFIPVGTKDISFSAERLDEIYHTVELNTAAVDDNTEYFEKIMSLCQQNGIRVILVVTPISDAFILRSTNLDETMSWYQQQAAAYGCEYYDFNLVRNRGALYPQETAFYDATHLSESGAETFSRQLSEVIAMADAGEDVSGLFYGSYSEAEETMIARIRGA